MKSFLPTKLFLVFVALIGLLIAQKVPLAQFAISHGHCNLLANAFVNKVDVVTIKEDFSDILINFSIDMNSLHSFNQQTTNELKSELKFNTTENPYMVFKCEDNFRLGENWFQLRGILTINGISNYVRLMLTPEHAGIKNSKQINHYFISGEVNLFDYGIIYPEEITRIKTMFININMEISEYDFI